MLLMIVAMTTSYVAMAQCDAGYEAKPTTADKAHVKVTKVICKDENTSQNSGQTNVSGNASGSGSGNVGVAKASGNLGGGVEHKGSTSSSSSGTKSCTTTEKYYSCEKKNDKKDDKKDDKNK